MNSIVSNFSDVKTFLPLIIFVVVIIVLIIITNKFSDSTKYSGVGFDILRIISGILLGLIVATVFYFILRFMLYAMHPGVGAFFEVYLRYLYWALAVRAIIKDKNVYKGIVFKIIRILCVVFAVLTIALTVLIVAGVIKKIF